MLGTLAFWRRLRAHVTEKPAAMHLKKLLIVAAVVVALLSAFWIILSAFLEEHLPQMLPTPEDGYVYSFDFVVVGAGTAGSVLAALLAKHSNSTILLLEAGDRFGLLSKIPLLTTFQQKGLNDWAFLSVPQQHSSRAMHERRQCLPRGRGLGGSALLNYMLHFEGLAADFDERWNLSDWRWDSVRSFLQAANSHDAHDWLSIDPHYSQLMAAMQRAETEFAHRGWCFRRARYTIRRGLRHSVLQRFLLPELKRSNLRVMTNAMARHILLQEATSGGEKHVKSVLVGVKESEGGRGERLFHVHVRRELIISAGAYQSPQLLLASGIGDVANLQRLQIPPQHESPHVGQHLHDHLNLPIYVSIDVVGPTLNQRALLDPLSLLNYIMTGGGHLGNFGVLGHVDGRLNPTTKTGEQEVAFGLTLFGAGAIDESALMAISNFKREHFRALFPRYHNASQEGFVMIATCLQPKSRGSVTLSSDSGAAANVRRPPLIDPNYLSADEDVSCMIRAIRAAVELITSEAFARLGPRIHWPRLKACANFGPFARDFQLNRPADNYLECVLRHCGLGSHHPGGTCTMGARPEQSVVDSRFRLHGVGRLRVVDASVLPTPVSGNPNSIIVGMALRSATMILQDQKAMQDKDDDLS